MSGEGGQGQVRAAGAGEGGREMRTDRMRKRGASVNEACRLRCQGQHVQVLLPGARVCPNLGPGFSMRWHDWAIYCTHGVSINEWVWAGYRSAIRYHGVTDRTQLN